MIRPGFSPYVPRPIDLPTAVPLAPEADLSVLDEAKIFAAPDDPADWPAWRAAITRWRDEARSRIGYDPCRYETMADAGPRIVEMVWLWDERLYDFASGRFTVDAYLDAGEAEFGGFDGVMLWNAYPVLGIDSRDHFAFFEDLPELPQIVAAFQRRGVKVYFTYYPWETGSGPEAIDRVTAIVKRCGFDAVFLDSSKEASSRLRTALDAIDPALPIECESRVPLAQIADQTMSWAQWFADSKVPGVLRAKWFERRHELHHIRRWNRSHLDELHSAWLNGTGVLVWPVVFGVWVGWNTRDRSILSHMRRLYADNGAHFISESWTPLADHPGSGAQIYASRWETSVDRLWTLVNRGGDHTGPLLLIEPDQNEQGIWVDLVSGQTLAAERQADGRIALSGTLSAGAIACIANRAAPPTVTGPDIALAAPDFPARVTERVPAPFVLHATAPEGMVPLDIPDGELTVTYRLRETGLYGEAPYVDEWKPLPPRLHQIATMTRPLSAHRIAMARHEVTNTQFAQFLAETGYAPVRSERFLAHWKNGAPLPGTENDPVTHIELDDARAYAAWAGLRLPTEDEWQVAAQQGLLNRAEPLIWNLTESEHRDGRTRFSILKGGCAPLPQVSDWYVESGPLPLERSVKLLALGAGLNRSPMIGFRCAADIGKNR
jgi:formylglycine-generating enzyme